MLGDLFYNLGVAIGGLGSRLPGKPGAEPADTDQPDEYQDGAGPMDPFGHAGEMMAGAAGAWAMARFLRPRPVSWTRVVIAGVAATFLADLATRTFDRDGPYRPSPLDDDPESILRRFGSGVAMAAGYAALLYPRLPGSPLVRGLAFGAIEVAAAQRGGLVRLASTVPGLRYPLQGLAVPAEEDAGPFAHMAFGLGLGLFYRFDHEDDSDDEEVDEDLE